jgi:hypothetical protein
LFRRAAIVAAAVGLAQIAAAGDLSQRWRTLETEHFLVHYYEPHGDLARRVAVLAERAHRVLTPALGHVPEDRTHITITDDVDGANGFASAVPRNQIGLFATAPDALSVLADHDDWLYGLVAHEYVHVIHLDTISGLPRLYNQIFGKRWSPNNIQPRWFIEGLATYEESRRTSGGRMRNALFEMYLRMAVLAGKPLELDALSSGPLAWPHGHAFYLYGGFFLKYIADRYGDEALATISRDYGAQPIPWGLSRSVKRATGKDYLELYDDWLRHLRARYALQRAAVERRGRIEGARLTDTGEYNLHPRFTRDGAIVWLQHDGRRRGGHRVRDARGARDLVTVEGAGRFSLLPDGSGLVAERGLTHRTHYFFTDLFRIGLDGRVTRLTEGARAAGPDVAPDGRRVACTINGASRQRLAIVPLEEGARPRVIWEGERWDQAFDPAWSPDGQRLVFSVFRHGGAVDLHLWEGGRTRQLTDDRARDVTPRFGPDGRHVYFASDRTGIYNVYRLELATGALAQVTNVLGGAFAPDVSGDGRRLVYSGFDGDGFEIYELELDELTLLPPEPYVNDRPDPVRIVDAELPPTPPRAYRPLHTLAPNVYTVSSTLDSFGSSLTLATSGVDVAGHHAWWMSGSVGSGRGDVTFGVAYSYNRLWPGLSLGLGRWTGHGGGLVVDGAGRSYVAESWGASAGVFLPVVRLPEVYSDLGFSYELSWSRNLDGPITHDPHAAVPRLPELGVASGVTVRWFLSDVRGFAYSLGPVEGTGLSLATRFDHPNLGAGARAILAFWRWDQYQRLPWWGHVFALRLSGAYGESDPPGRVRFFLGGAPRQDLVQAIIDSTRTGNAWLRGYPEGSLSGNQMHLLNLEYRVPLLDVERGLATLPFYFRRLHLAALLDVGNAFDGPLRPAELRVAAGATLRLDTTFGFYMPGSFDLGIARGLTHGGSTEAWLLLTSGL